ncbi:MAG: adenylate/guanylate cyclase domain-containing protein [Verrucomicrobiota bacterium]
MFRLNFAPRLMLAMLFIVTLVAVSLFAVTRRSLESAWRQIFEARFLSQMESLASLQKARLDSIGERCQELAGSATVIEAVQSENGVLPEEIHRELLERARVVRDSVSSFESQNTGRGTSRPGGGGPGGAFPDFQGPPSPQQMAALAEMRGSGLIPKEGAPEGPRRGPRWVRPDTLDLALMDASGRIHTLKAPGEPDAQTAWLEKNKVSRVPASQEVAYLAVKPAAGSRSRRPMLSEVIITPIQKAGTEAALGALVVGLPVSSYGETALYDLNRRGKPGELFTGLWIDDQLFSRSIPREAIESVSTMVRNNLKNPGTSKEALTVAIEGKPHQLLFRSLNPESSTPQAYQITLYSLAGLSEEQSALRGQIIGFSGLAYGAAALLCGLISRRMVHPVRNLVDGTRQIMQGHYDTRVPITTHDELATLATSFNEMAAGLKQRQQYRDILFQVSDDDIARQLIETACLGGERREITVLFCDIRDFTATTSGMPPEGVIDLLNEHMTALTEIVHRHHGVVDKFVGDLIMAIFGAPKSYGDDSGNAAACALEMVTRRDALNQTTAHPPLLMGIGIASGTAIAGCMGSENRLNYTVLGEPVNLASRLCSSAGPREVIIDPHTAQLLGSRAIGRQLSPMTLKGFPQPVLPVLLLQLQGAPDDSSRPSGTSSQPPEGKVVASSSNA